MQNEDDSLAIRADDMTEALRFWIGTSWKMNKTLAEAKSFAEGLVAADSTRDPRIQRFVIPSFTAVREVKAMLAETSVKVGAQNMHWADDGAWTGEVSPLMLKDCNLDIVELGHSERREHFGETDETVGLKTEAAVRHGLIPLICIGETLPEREGGRARDVLERQVRGALGMLSGTQKSAQILLAYEPVWAIGVNGIPATSDYADARQAEIVAVAENMLGRRVPCLYGGSVNPGNCEELISCPHIDGLFIGRSAWNVAGYLDILAKCAARIQIV
jgi:triosephosphate isomerase